MKFSVKNPREFHKNSSFPIKDKLLDEKIYSISEVFGNHTANKNKARATDNPAAIYQGLENTVLMESSIIITIADQLMLIRLRMAVLLIKELFAHLLL